MSPRAVIAAVAITLGLAIVALLLTNKRPPSPTSAQTPTPQATFNPALVTSIGVKRPSGADERVTRNDAGQWHYIAGRIEWPALPPETLVSALAALPAEFSKRSEAAPAAGGPTITLALRDGTAYALRLAPTSLGGRTAAALTTPEGATNILIENSVLDPLLNPGPAGWRSTAAVPSVRDCSRVTLDDGRSSLALARLEGKWSMRRPINARASEPAVSLLLGALADIRVIRFESAESHDLTAMGLTKPALTITAETDVRASDATGNVRVHTVTRELIVGGPADPKGDTRFAAADPDGSILFVIPASAVNALSLAPRNYLHPTVSGVSPGDIFMVAITDTTVTPGGGAGQRGFRRESGGWTTINLDGTRAPADAQAVNDLLEFLTSRPGEPEPFRPDDDIRTLRKIELMDAEGDPSEVLTAGYTSDGLFAVRSGNLLVTFNAANAPAILAMPAFGTLAPEGPAPTTPTMPTDAPTGK
ncbi:MAG: DUF4340 domain-containing protein [Phycisphaerae bacterium]|nr:DUF4340 domain-containing protein [Phycisphaerae bacterium]